MQEQDSDCTAAVHGDKYAYNRYGCRCPQARAAHAEAKRQTRRRQGIPPAPAKVPGGRYRNMLRRLRDEHGHTQADLADRLGWSTSRVSTLMRGRGRITVETAERVEELHTLLTRGTYGQRSAVKVSERVARMWRDDPVRVEQAAHWSRSSDQLLPAERAELAERLRTRAGSAEEAAAWLRVTERTVQRWGEAVQAA